MTGDPISMKARSHAGKLGTLKAAASNTSTSHGLALPNRNRSARRNAKTPSEKANRIRKMPR